MMQDRYLDLLKQTLTGYLFPESADSNYAVSGGGHPKKIIGRAVQSYLARRGIRLTRRGHFDREKRRRGNDWPSIGYTMVGLMRLDNVQFALEAVEEEGVPGDVIECGVWRGGCSIFMKAVLRQLNSDRHLWLADSFSGMPKPDATHFPADEGYDLSEVDYLSTTLDQVKENFDRFGLLGPDIHFLKGWFSETLPTAEITQISVLGADGDLYESTIDILRNLYSKVSNRGFVIIDDYGSWEPCRKAVTEFRAEHGITAEIIPIDDTGAYWRK